MLPVAVLARQLLVDTTSKESTLDSRYRAEPQSMESPCNPAGKRWIGGHFTLTLKVTAQERKGANRNEPTRPMGFSLAKPILVPFTNAVLAVARAAVAVEIARCLVAAARHTLIDALIAALAWAWIAAALAAPGRAGFGALAE